MAVPPLHFLRWESRFKQLSYSYESMLEGFCSCLRPQLATTHSKCTQQTHKRILKILFVGITFVHMSRRIWITIPANYESKLKMKLLVKRKVWMWVRLPDTYFSIANSYTIICRGTTVTSLVSGPLEGITIGLSFSLSASLFLSVIMMTSAPLAPCTCGGCTV